jgi:hypothetical protein
MTEQMQIDEEIAIEVLEILSNSNLDHKTNVSTTNKKFEFTYEELLSNRSQASIVKKKLKSRDEIILFKKLRRRVLSRIYSKKSRTKRRIVSITMKSERDIIIDKVNELFSDHPNFQQFREFIQQTLQDNQIIINNVVQSAADVSVSSDIYKDLPDLIDASE